MSNIKLQTMTKKIMHWFLLSDESKELFLYFGKLQNDNDTLKARIAELEALVNVSEGLYERIYEQAARIAELENELEGKRVFTDTLFYDIYRLQSRIAELENFINQLIEAGESEDSPMPAVWLELVNDWKERDQ